MPEPPQRISFDPEPPVQGHDVTISYDFDGAGINQTRLRVRFGPSGEPKEYTVTKDGPSVTITVPSDATRMHVEDLDGPSPDNSSIVVPPDLAVTGGDSARGQAPRS